jgi:hypothetical protein
MRRNGNNMGDIYMEEEDKYIQKKNAHELTNRDVQKAYGENCIDEIILFQYNDFDKYCDGITQIYYTELIAFTQSRIIKYELSRDYYAAGNSEILKAVLDKTYKDEMRLGIPSVKRSEIIDWTDGKNLQIERDIGNGRTFGFKVQGIYFRCANNLFTYERLKDEISRLFSKCLRDYVVAGIIKETGQANIDTKMLTEINDEIIKNVFREDKTGNLIIKIDNLNIIKSQVVDNKRITIDNSVLLRTNICGEDKKPFNACPYCGESIDLLKTPKFCPYCKEKLTKD